MHPSANIVALHRPIRLHYNLHRFAVVAVLFQHRESESCMGNQSIIYFYRLITCYVRVPLTALR